MSETPQLTPEQLAAGREKRRARLFERHCDGDRLTRDERAEIADLIQSAEMASRANQLTLEPSPAQAVSKRTGLAHPLQHYADRLNLGLRTVKRWLAEGVRAKDPCPLDNLAAFPEWWKRVHPGRALDTRVALSIERVLQGGAQASAAVVDGGAQVAAADPGAAAEGKGGAAPASTAAPGPAKPLIALNSVAAMSHDENLLKLNSIHAANIALLERAFREGTQNEVDARQHNVERSARMLHAAQRALAEHLRESGDLIPREEIKRDLQRVHSAMAQSLISVIIGLGIHRERAIAVVDGWFRHLRESRFAPDTQPELRPPSAAVA